MLALFPDTNFLMECRSLPELPWRELPSHGGHVQIVLGRSVVREVDRFKSDGKGRRNRRARNLSSGLFRQLLEAAGQPVVLRESGPRVDVVLSGARPVPAPDLDLAHPDDRIVAEAIAHGRDDELTFFSHDTVALHTANAQGLKWLRIPDGWLAEPEPDSHQKQVARLERRVRLLEGASPAIQIALRTERATIHVVRHATLPDALIAELVEHVKRRFPVKLDFHDARSVGALWELGKFQPPSSSEIEEYQGSKYPEWVQSIERRLTSLPKQLSAKTRCAEITIEIENTGGAPARESQLEFWLSDGLVFLYPLDKAQRRMASSSLPSPPVPPAVRSTYDQLRSLFDPHPSPRALAALNSFQQERRDPHNFYYKPVPNDRDARHVLECEVLRHRVEPTLFRFLVFAERDVTGGTITCRVTASNLSEPAVTAFPIRIDYEDGDAVQTAREIVAQLCGDGDEESPAS